MQQKSAQGKNSILHKAFVNDRDGMSVQWERALTFQ